MKTNQNNNPYINENVCRRTKWKEDKFVVVVDYYFYTLKAIAFIRVINVYL